jgi:hypothetical protein
MARGELKEVPLCQRCDAIRAYSLGWKPIHVIDFMDVGKVARALKDSSYPTPQQTGLDKDRINQILSYLEREREYQEAVKETPPAEAEKATSGEP